MLQEHEIGVVRLTIRSKVCLSSSRPDLILLGSEMLPAAKDSRRDWDGRVKFSFPRLDFM